MDSQCTKQTTTIQIQKDNLINTPPILSPPSLWLSKRLLVAVLMFLCHVNRSFLRFNISIAVVEMTSAKQIHSGNSTELMPAPFDWDSKTVGLVMSMFYYGGLLSFIGGPIGAKLGGAVSCSLFMMLSAITTILQPISLKYGFNLFLACRLFTGIFESFFTVSMADICAQWIPIREKSKLMAFSVIGFQTGVAFVHSFCAFLASGWGWTMVFYATGSICLISSILCFFLVKNQPLDDPRISKRELMYILEGTATSPRKMAIHPYKKILTSGPVWALFISRFTQMWLFTILITCLPLYVKDLSHRDIKEIGMLSSIPNILSIFMLPICGILLDCARNANISVTKTHKILTSGAFIFGGVIFLAVSIISDFMFSLIAFVLIQMSLAIISLVSQILIISIAPNSSSVIAGLCLFAYSTSSISAHNITGFMTTNHSLQEWNNCFLLTSGVSILSAVIFTVYGSSEAQSWSTSSPDKPEEFYNQSNQNQSVKKMTK
ncbi:vesicular glutamate transporter 2.2-like [Planococcus citri]|uniref:vesicular glutamate transporter 2.2-like n=1 Tax=Planococcus citri TaxID=170843 RepID=UPI0031F9E78E